MKTIYTLTICLTFSIVSLFYVVIKAKQIYKQYTAIELILEINEIFDESIDEEILDRLKEINMPTQHFLDPRKQSIDYITLIMTNKEIYIDTVTIEKSESGKLMTMDKKRIQNLQSFLLSEGFYANAWHLDSIFRKNLKEKKFNIRSFVRVVNNVTGQTLSTIHSEKFYENSYKTGKITIGLLDEVTYEACYDITPWEIRKKLPNSIFYLIICGLISIFTIIILIYGIFLRYRKVKGSLEKNKIVVFPDIYLYKDRYLLQNNYAHVVLTSQMVILFELFATNPEHFASYAQITRKLWGNMADSADRLNQLIKRTRTKIQPLTEISIENIPGVGYQLIFNGQESEL